MAQKWTEGEEQYLRESFEDGIPDDIIAKNLGRTQTAIKVKRHKCGIQGDPRARRLSNYSRSKMGCRLTGSESPSWRGGRRISSGGYIEIHEPSHHRARQNGYVFEHILVAEKKIGRKLDKNECIHHEDDDKQNNEESNIIILDRGNHTEHHARLRSSRVEMICIFCGGSFWTKQSHVKIRKTCSKSCAAKNTLWRKRYVSE